MASYAELSFEWSMLCQECVDCWSVSDLQLAAELGKTLLERNRELEATIKHQNGVIDDQIQEIEYLSKQTAALREVNDSRLRIYEQLEVSIQDLEKTNQRLASDNNADKKKIKNLTSTLDNLEGRYDELHKTLEETKAAQQQRARSKRKSHLSTDGEQNTSRRSRSCEGSKQVMEDGILKNLEAWTKIEELQDSLKNVQNNLSSVIKKKEELEIEISYLEKENYELGNQLATLREHEMSTTCSINDELSSVEDCSSSRLCRKCMAQVDETSSNPTVHDLNDSIEDTDISIESVHGECALVRLNNGGYAWGSQESLSSLGHVVNHFGSSGTSPTEEAYDAPHNSLLSELDAQYRILIEKYETLLQTREKQHEQNQLVRDSSNRNSFINPSNIGEMNSISGPVSLMVMDSSQAYTLKCQRCATCSCDLQTESLRPKSSIEEYSEVETLSSGFSEGESRLASKRTQTDEIDNVLEYSENIITPISKKVFDLASPINPCEKRFQSAPEYKKIFREIFSVLKQTVSENSTSEIWDDESNGSLIKKTDVDGNYLQSNVENKTNNVVEDLDKTITKDIVVFEVEDLETVSGTESKSSCSDNEKQPIYSQSIRPDTLQLDQGSHSSCKPKKKKRHHKSPGEVECLQNRTVEILKAQDARRKRSLKKVKKETEVFEERVHKVKMYLDQESSVEACEHRSSSRHKHKSNKKRGLHACESTGSRSHNLSQKTENQERSHSKPVKEKIVLPSQEVAKLRKLEMTYADVLKSALTRAHSLKKYS